MSPERAELLREIHNAAEDARVKLRRVQVYAGHALREVERGQAAQSLTSTFSEADRAQAQLSALVTFARLLNVDDEDLELALRVTVS